MEADPILVRDEVIAIDHEETGRIVIRLAESAESFLRAMIQMQLGWADLGALGGDATLLVDACTRLAGGDQYRGIYKEMAPILEDKPF